MSFYEKGNTRIHYEDVGSGYPLLIIPGGGLNSKIDFYTLTAPFHASRELQSEYRCITPDLRNAPEGQSTGPLEVVGVDPGEEFARIPLFFFAHSPRRRQVAHRLTTRAKGHPLMLRR